MSRMFEAVEAGGAGEAHGPAAAIIGMAGRFPGARSVDELWSNLAGGVHSITFFSHDELRASGVSPALLADPGYVGAGGVLEDADRFDAAFFGFSPREAEILDPQHRVFLEAAWEALENAGYAPGSGHHTVGIYAGSSASDYLAHHVLARPGLAAAVGSLQLGLANEKDFLATRAAHKLDLRGPALNLQTGCSTGLVAVHVACQALAAGECDVAVAGGVSVSPGQGLGYRHQPGGIASPDGHCRAFDARAAGTVGGSGVALVVLRRLADAVADRDTIRAVVRGSAINNDGAGRMGFTAPSVPGQAAVIEEALAVAGVDPETVGYVEAHGSGTPLGDPVEAAALVQAFGPTRRRQFCALGSVKTNIGHLDAAAGAAGLVKTVLALEHGQVPPSLHFTAPNPAIDFAQSPFFVNTELRPWPGDGSGPRRAGVSSFGIGGTNAHVVLEEAPAAAPAEPRRPWHLLVLSARTPAALEAATDRLAAHLRAHPGQALCDVAYTLQTGRRAWEHRRAVVARTGADAAAALEVRAPDRVFGAAAPAGDRPVTFLFPGLGSHYGGMGRGLYHAEPVYRDTVDRCAELLLPHLGLDLRDVLFEGEAADEEGGPEGIDLRAMLGRAAAEPAEPAERLNRTCLAQPALFVTEYALARLWMSWGVRPEAMIGHSLGEYVAATVAGVWSLEDALMLAAERARLIEELPEGGMMGAVLSEAEEAPFLRDGLCVGARNGPLIPVFSGPVAALDALQEELGARGIVHRRLPLRHAFHSSMMEPVAERLTALMRRVELHPPRIPFVSNVTGDWIRDSEATDPAYWARHLCGTVRFSEGVETLARQGQRVLLEVGPGHALRMLATQLPVWGDAPPTVVASLRHGYERSPDLAHVQRAAGRLWAAGVPLDWEAVHAGERLRRVPLPGYPFERARYWIERRGAAPGVGSGAMAAATPDPAEPLHLPTWTRAPLPARAPMEPTEWLLLADSGELGGLLAGRLEAVGHAVTVAEAGAGFGSPSGRRFTVRPGVVDDLAALRDALASAGRRPRRVVHLWGTGPGDGDDAGAFERAHARGHAAVAALARVFGDGAAEGALRLVVVTESVHDVTGGEPLRPERATVLGACRAVAREHGPAACRVVDVRPSAGGAGRLAEQLLAEVTADASEAEVALRGPLRWARGYQAARLADPPGGVRAEGAYLFCGAFVPGADVLAGHLAGGARARIAVVVDPAFPQAEAWDAVLAATDEAGPTCTTIRGIRAAEARGGPVRVFRASAGDAAGLRAAILAARETMGGLRGIVHCAGAEAGSAAVPGPPADSGAELARVARELAALGEAVDSVPRDFLLLWNPPCSPSNGAAAARGALMDAWAQRQAADGGRWTSVSWLRPWRRGGDDTPAEAAAFARRALEGQEARVFDGLAALGGEPRVVLSLHDPHAAEGGGAPRAADVSLHPRPALASEALSPTSEAEEVLAGFWRELLGIAEIGIRDDFFELGGNSLVGIQLVSRVRDAFQVELPLRAVFEAPTIAALAELIDEAILLELDEMSEEEALRLVGEASA